MRRVVVVVVVASLAATRAFAPRPLFRASTSSSSFTARAESSRPDGGGETRAGTSGYSVLRRPLRWDSESDPTFRPPTMRDEDEERKEERRDAASWWGNVQRKETTNETEEEDDAEETSSFTATATTTTPASRSSSSSSSSHGMDLFDRTLTALDYHVVLRALEDACATTPGKETVRRRPSRPSTGDDDDADDDDRDVLTASSVEGVEARYGAVRELVELSLLPEKELRAPVLDRDGTTLAVSDVFVSAEEQGRVLEGPELTEIATVLDVAKDVREWAERLRTYNDGTDLTKPTFVRLPELVWSDLDDLPYDLSTLLDDAFERRTGALSGTTFPAVGALRSQIRSAKRAVLSTLYDELLPTLPLSLESGGDPASEVNGRIVVPVEASKAAGVGIVHDASRSGGTVYVEPAALVGPTNELRGLENDLRREEAKAWRQLTDRVLEEKDAVERCVAACARLDLAQARRTLGERLAEHRRDDGNGNDDDNSKEPPLTIPDVRDEGVIDVTDARHPVLLLRGVDNVVGSDLVVGRDGNRGLVLTGPNAGGKTVVLKAIGLFALMARDGVPLPCRPEGARVDVFDPVLADVGDAQSVDADLSTFSGHLVVCREVLNRLDESSVAGASLVLLDELGSGTDPDQGVALARALLEAVVERGARVAVTTHYRPLKDLAAVDDRFRVAGMEFANNEPTYRLAEGRVVESFALSVAERLGLPRAVLDRADDLLDEDTRRVGELLADLERRAADMDDQAKDMERRRRDVDARVEELRLEKERAAEEAVRARREEAERFAARLREKEAVLEKVLDRLKADPSRKVLAASWDDIRYVRRDALDEAETGVVVDANAGGSATNRVARASNARHQRPAELVPLADYKTLPPDLKEGDELVVCKEGAQKGKRVKIAQIPRSKSTVRQITVTLNNMSFRMKTTELALPVPGVPEPDAKRARGRDDGRGKNNMSKVARRALAEMEGDADHDHNSSKRKGVRNNNNNNNNDDAILGDKSLVAAVARKRGKGGGGGVVVRTESNTLDLRGDNFDEGRRRCEDFFSRAVVSDRRTVFVLHGHGTGVLKTKLRAWFKTDREWVRSYKPAAQADGGDAFTQVTLKGLDL